MKLKPKQNIVLDFLKKEKTLTIDYSKDYVEYDHLTGEKIFHGRMKEAIKIRVPYLKCTSTIHLRDKKCKLEQIVESTYYTVDGQSINETIIDLDIIATTRVTEDLELMGIRSFLRPISDEYFDSMVTLGEIQLEKPNIEYKIIREG